MVYRKIVVGTLWILAVLVVCATGWAQQRFIDNGDGTISDRQLGLMWAKSDNQGDINWHEAGQWIRYTFPSTVPGNYDNWRMPTLDELESLVTETPTYESDCGQEVRIVDLIKLSCGWVWTSKIDKISPTAWVYNFNRVYSFSVRKAQRRGYRALAVRNMKQP